MKAARWVAVGDSFTAGTGDDPQHGGWVARTANALARAGCVGDFCNLAVPGARLAEVLDHQVPSVVDRVDIISAIAGANDLMARRVDLPIVLRQMDELLDWALDHADLVLTCTCPDFLVSRSAQLPRLASRIDNVNEHVEQRRTGAAGRLVVVNAHAVLAEPATWATDGIHANPRGHALLAETAIRLLEQAPLPLR
jgi:lysophospholipase L1-like esterase